MESTARGKFEGGDSAWEEEKMKSYKKSEVRLIEIQEKLCKDVERGQKQVGTYCVSLFPVLFFRLLSSLDFFPCLSFI